MLADQDVVEHGHVLEEPDGLEGARDAAPHDRVGAQADEAPALEEDLALRPAGMRPVTTLKKVVLPAPFGPIRPDDGRARGMTRSTWLTRDQAAEAPWSRPGPRAAVGRAASRGADALRSHAGMLSARGGGGAAATAPGSSRLVDVDGRRLHAAPDQPLGLEAA